MHLVHTHWNGVSAVEIGHLKAFQAIVKEGTISHAAVSLRISQPALSRQLRELEKSLGTQLVIRSNKKVELTAAGHTLLTRAEDILSLVHLTKAELAHPGRQIQGTLRIGAAESPSFALIAQVIADIQREHPHVQAVIRSGNGYSVEAGIEDGTLTFGLFIEPWDLSRYNSIQMPHTDAWGLLVHTDSALAQLDSITADELGEIPILTPERVVNNDGISDWLSTGRSPLNVVGTYNLLFNAVHMVRQGIGSALCIDGLVEPTTKDVRFLPLRPSLHSRLHLAWNANRQLTPLEKHFAERIDASINK